MTYNSFAACLQTPACPSLSSRDPNSATIQPSRLRFWPLCYLLKLRMSNDCKAGSHFSSHSARGCTKGSNMFPASCPARAKNCSKGCHTTVRVACGGCGLLLLIPAADGTVCHHPGPPAKMSQISAFARTDADADAACSPAQAWRLPVLMYNRRSGASGFTLPCNSTKRRMSVS